MISLHFEWLNYFLLSNKVQAVKMTIWHGLRQSVSLINYYSSIYAFLS